MKLTFLGVRGTTPVSGKDKNKYGGHTLCTQLVTCTGELIIVDAGTGIKIAGDWLMHQESEKELNIHILFTHFHLDHIIGLPFFSPLYSPKTSLTFYADITSRKTEKYLSGLMADRFFPLDFKDTSSKKIFKKIPEGNFRIGGVNISHCPLLHPQGSIGYKFQEKKAQIVLATDTEHPEDGPDRRLITFAQGAEIIIYDAFFTPEEYEAGRKNWGHSTWLEGTKVAREAGVSRLYLSHYNPDHSDDEIDAIISLSRREFPETYGAQEGLELTF